MKGGLGGRGSEGPGSAGQLIGTRAWLNTGPKGVAALHQKQGVQQSAIVGTWRHCIAICNILILSHKG